MQVHGVQVGGAVILGLALVADSGRMDLHPAHTAAPVLLRSGESIHSAGVVLCLSAVFHSVQRLIAGVIRHPHHTGGAQLQLGQIQGNAAQTSRFRLHHGRRGQHLRPCRVQHLHHGNVLVVPGRHRQVAGAQGPWDSAVTSGAVSSTVMVVVRQAPAPSLPDCSSATTSSPRSSPAVS